MQLRRFADVQDFLGAAGEFLGAREAEHCLLLGISSNIQAHPELHTDDDPPWFALVSDDANRPVGVSLRTPPFQQVLSEIDDLEAVDLIVDALAGEDLPGILGPRLAAARFAELWSARTGVTARKALAERIFRLTEVIPPRPISGAWRLAEERDRSTLAEWFIAFRNEAAPHDPVPEDLDSVVTHWIERVGRSMYFWEVDGRVVSLVGAGGRTPNGVRIGPVYTPPEERRRGYASALTAAVSQEQLDAGRRFVFLFTDLANPTSNKIYQAIGYRPVTDVDQYRFGEA